LPVSLGLLTEALFIYKEATMNTPEVEEQVSLQDDIATAYDEQAEETEIVEAVPDTPPEPAYEPPSMWSKEYKDVFNEWGQLERGREYQKAMLELYGNTQSYVTQREQEAARYRQQVEQWNSVIEPYKQQLDLRGMEPAAFVRQVMGYYQQLNQNPATTIRQLAQNYNLDLASLGADEPYRSPSEIANMQQTAMIQRQLQNVLQQQRQGEFQRLHQQIDTFASETDASGNPLRPYFEQVKDTMTKLIRGGTASGLNDAYDMACKLSPELMAQAEAQRAAAETARKAADAKKAKTASIRATGKHTGAASKRSLKEDIEAAYDSMTAA